LRYIKIQKIVLKDLYVIANAIVGSIVVVDWIAGNIVIVIVIVGKIVVYLA